MKTAFDWLYHEWANKTIGFVGYGSVGGGHAIEHMRGSASSCKMAPVWQAVHVPIDVPIDVYMSMMKLEAPCWRGGPAGS